MMGLHDRNIQALEYYFKSKNIFETLHAKARIATANNNIGVIYQDLKNYEQAKNYYNKAYSEWSEIKDSSKIPAALNNIGSIYLEQKDTTKALDFFQTILKKFSEHVDTALLQDVTSNIASVLVLKGDFRKALPYYQKSLFLADILHDKYKKAIALDNISNLYIESNHYDTAIVLAKQAVKIAEEIGAYELVKTGYSRFAEIFNKTGQYQKAYEASMKAFKILQDTIYRDMKTRYDVAETNYNLDKLKNINNDIAVKKKDTETNNRLLVISVFLLILTLVIVLLLYKSFQIRQTNKNIIEKQRSIILEKQLKEWELIALRAQMNPHFIFNALSSIKSYILEKNNDAADYYLTKFAKLMRLILDNSSQDFILLEKELELLHSYINLEEMRFKDKFIYKIEVDSNINTLETFIPSMIIQPFVENSIVHGLLHKKGACCLKIKVTQSEGKLYITVEDNGVGRLRSRDKSKTISHESKGYRMTEQRLKALSRDRDDAAHISYKDLSDIHGNTGTYVEILIPLNRTESTDS